MEIGVEILRDNRRCFPSLAPSQRRTVKVIEVKGFNRSIEVMRSVEYLSYHFTMGSPVLIYSHLYIWSVYVKETGGLYCLYNSLAP